VNKDLTLVYSGGSGGFIALHGIVLSGIHHADKYGINSDANDIINQWGLIAKNGINSWRDFEIWPNNTRTKENNHSHKLYYNCNIGANDFININSTKVVIYTDITMQYKLMKLKNANIVLDENMGYPSKWDAFYDNIRKYGWEDCAMPYDMKYLPMYIRDEIHDNYTKSIEFFGSESKTHKDILISNVSFYCKYADYKISLHDIVKTKFRVMTDMLGIPYKKEHEQLMDIWLGLHPQDLQMDLLNYKEENEY
jgi:hypothetical protein